jgi:hypothetical protein
VSQPGGRGTRSGSTLERAIEAALVNNGYGIEKQKDVGTRPSGGRHKVDIAVTRPSGTKFLMSLKWQQVGGTTEEKIPYEIIKLLHGLRENGGAYDKAYILLGGDGWSSGMVNFYLSEQFRSYIRGSERIEVLLMNDAIKRANQDTL